MPTNRERAARADVAASWFLLPTERGNRASDIRAWTTGNAVEPLIDGATYFRRLHQELCAAQRGDQIYLADFRGDTEELLDGPDTSIGDVLRRCARSGIVIFGLIWRSQPNWLEGSEGKNAELTRDINEAGGDVLLDARTRRAGSHHQKFVIIRHPDRPAHDIAFVGGIDLGLSRHDDTAHGGDAQTMDFPQPTGIVRPGMTCRSQSAARPSTTWRRRFASDGTAAVCWTCPVRSG